MPTSRQLKAFLNRHAGRISTLTGLSMGFLISIWLPLWAFAVAILLYVATSVASFVEGYNKALNPPPPTGDIGPPDDYTSPPVCDCYEPAPSKHPDVCGRCNRTRA